MTNDHITIKEPGPDDFFPCAAEIMFGAAAVEFRCQLGCGHSGPHKVDCSNIPTFMDGSPSRVPCDISITWHCKTQERGAAK